MTGGVPAADPVPHPADGPRAVAPAASGGEPGEPGPFRLYGPALEKDPRAWYDEMRRVHGPVVPVLLEGDVPAWLVIGYRELIEVLGDPELFTRDSRHWNAWDRIPPDWPLRLLVEYQPSVTYATGAEHQRRIEAISDALADVDRFELRAQVERIADGLIDDFAGSGEADLIGRYAHPIPMLAMAGIIGLPDADAPAVARDALSTLDAGEDAPEAAQRFIARIARLVNDKRENPGPDVTSRMLAASPGLTPDELTLDVLVVMVTGQATTEHWIGNTLRLMLTDERFATTLAGGRRSVGEALNEVLWTQNPGPCSLGRWATRDTRLAGRRIRAGDALILGMGGANMDPMLWHGPPGGLVGNQAHLSFGHGPRRCPYPAPEIAEIIARTAVEVLLDRLPDVTLAVPADTLRWRPSFQIRGLWELPVTFTACQ